MSRAFLLIFVLSLFDSLSLSSSPSFLLFSPFLLFHLPLCRKKSLGSCLGLPTASRCLLPARWHLSAWQDMPWSLKSFLHLNMDKTPAHFPWQWCKANTRVSSALLTSCPSCTSSPPPPGWRRSPPDRPDWQAPACSCSLSHPHVSESAQRRRLVGK